MTKYVNSPIKIGLSSSLSGEGYGAFSAYGFPFNMNHITAVNDKSETCWGEFCIYPKATSFITIQVVPACSTNPPTQYRVGSFCTNTHAKTLIHTHITSWERQLLFLQGNSLHQAKYLTFFILLSSSSFPPHRRHLPLLLLLFCSAYFSFSYFSCTLRLTVTMGTLTMAQVRWVTTGWH